MIDILLTVRVIFWQNVWVSIIGKFAIQLFGIKEFI